MFGFCFNATKKKITPGQNTRLICFGTSWSLYLNLTVWLSLHLPNVTNVLHVPIISPGISVNFKATGTSQQQKSWIVRSQHKINYFGFPIHIVTLKGLFDYSHIRNPKGENIYDKPHPLLHILYFLDEAFLRQESGHYTVVECSEHKIKAVFKHNSHENSCADSLFEIIYDFHFFNYYCFWVFCLIGIACHVPWVKGCDDLRPLIGCIFGQGACYTMVMVPSFFFLAFWWCLNWWHYFAMLPRAD